MVNPFCQPASLPGTEAGSSIDKNHLRLDKKEYDNVQVGSFIVQATGTKAVESGKVEVYQVTKVIKEIGTRLWIDLKCYRIDS